MDHDPANKVVVVMDRQNPDRDGFYEELPDGTLRRITAWRPLPMVPPPSAEAE